MEGVDPISALPDEIKISVLSQLDVKYAIRTLVLSHSWRHLWTHLPCLRLGYLQDQLGVVGANVSSYWIQRVHHVVSSLRGPLVHFELVHRFLSNQTPLIQRLLDLLLQKGGVQTLHLEFFYHPLQVHLPPFHSLKVLQLYQCHVLLPTGFHGFNSLTTLELEQVEISNDHLHFLIHTSNNLTTFSGTQFVRNQSPLSVNFSSPLLRYLKFEIDHSIENVLVISAPCLEQVEIINYNQDRTDPSSKKLSLVALGLLISVATVSSLNLRCNILRRMCDAFFWLLRSMPFLEELNLTHGDYEVSDQINRVVILMEELLGKKRDGISCLNQTLKSVIIRTFLEAISC
ncbi:F-box family protein [Rhynchospora pubera]|uniref:F-box family protein n=1 Tax=Rhynchospora pubera TaxID=906938 RepID=A0AAV8GME6_9POAL|nr:F-box family protein [Rhynchospora pubera]